MFKTLLTSVVNRALKSRTSAVIKKGIHAKRHRVRMDCQQL